MGFPPNKDIILASGYSVRADRADPGTVSMCDDLGIGFCHMKDH